jgi:hypothetical protein
MKNAAGKAAASRGFPRGLCYAEGNTASNLFLIERGEFHFGNSPGKEGLSAAGIAVQSCPFVQVQRRHKDGATMGEMQRAYR